MSVADQDYNSAVEAVSTLQELVEQMHDRLDELVDFLNRADTPARIETIDLDAMTPVKEATSREVDKSIGVINPTDVTIYLGFGGGRATAAARALPVPPNSAIVLPVSAEDLEVGADAAALGSDTAVIYLLRFQAVQMFHLWRF